MRDWEWGRTTSGLPIIGICRGRTGILVPGSYEVTARNFGLPPSWIVPRVLQPSLALEAGDEALLEVELVQGGGLPMTFETSDGASANGGSRLETMTADSSDWKPHLTYHGLTETQFTCSLILEPGTLYRSIGALPPGRSCFRLGGEGYQATEADIFISAGSLAEWNPVVQKAP